jgi:hypothetical protein
VCTPDLLLLFKTKHPTTPNTKTIVDQVSTDRITQPEDLGSLSVENFTGTSSPPQNVSSLLEGCPVALSLDFARA